MLLHSAQVVTDTLSTVLLEGITIISQATVLAVLPFRVVQALEATPRLLVTGSWVCHINIVVTSARLACAAHL